MRIIFALWGLDRTGGVRVIFEVANRLFQKGHDVNIIALGGDKHWFPLRANSCTVAAIPWRYNVTYAGWRSGTQLVNILRMAKKLQDSDVTIATFYPTAYSVFTGGSGSLFYYIQNYEPLMYMQSDSVFSGLINRLMTAIANGTYRLPLNWLVNSSWANNILKKKFKREGMLVFPAIDHETFYPRQTFRKDKKKRVVCLGKTAPAKGLNDGLNAIKSVHKKMSNLELILYGSEPSIHIPVPGKYFFRPSDDELAKLYSSADVVICPSRFESFPLPPLEAMACGVPVVTTRYGTEDYAFDDQNCLVVPPKQPKLLSEAILKILFNDDLAERLKKEGLKTAQQFTWERTTERVEQIFKNIVR
jgi:glycosyltransferase involved in cell wall biosynthesis